MHLSSLNLYLLLCMVVCTACGRSKNVRNVLIDAEPELVGKRISFIDSIITEEKKEKVIFLFNDYDCGSCIDSGFQMTKNIDRLWGGKRVFVISTMVNSPFYQKRNNYYDYVYPDEKDLIRKELKYIQTPVLLMVDADLTVTKVVYPNLSSVEECSTFVSDVTIIQ